MPITNDYVAPSYDVNQSKEETIIKDRQPNDYLGKDAFLKLMITQLQYQDPLDPMDNKDSIAQMAQFSALEQMQNLNGNMQISQASIKLAIDKMTTSINSIQKALDAYGIKVPPSKEEQEDNKDDNVSNDTTTDDKQDDTSKNDID